MKRDDIELVKSFIRRKKYIECDDIVTFDPKDRDPSYSDVYRQHEKYRSSGQYELIYTPYTDMSSSGLCNTGLYPNIDEIIRRGGIIAGSFPLYLLIGTEFDDIDIFVTSKEDFNSIMEYITSFRCKINEFDHSMKFTIRHMKFNLIARIYRCKEEIVYGFDLPASQIMFTGKSLAYTPLLDHVINTGYMEVDGNRLSPTYFQRLNKYWKRGVIKTIYFPAYKIIRERLIEFPIFHQAWYLKDIPSRSEGFVSDDESCSDYGGFVNRFHHKHKKYAFKYKGLVFIQYTVKERKRSKEGLTFITSNPGSQINSTIFPTPVNSMSEWKTWVEKELEDLHLPCLYDDIYQVDDLDDIETDLTADD